MQCIPIPSTPLGTRHPVHRTRAVIGCGSEDLTPRLNVAEKFFDTRTPLPASRPSASRTWSLFTALASVTRRNLIAMHGCAGRRRARGGGRQRCLHAHYVASRRNRQALGRGEGAAGCWLAAVQASGGSSGGGPGTASGDSQLQLSCPSGPRVLSTALSGTSQGCVAAW